MKILLIGLNKYILSSLEFVKPLENQLLEKNHKVLTLNFKAFLNIKEKTRKKLLKNFDLIILSGTALKDFEYLKYWKKFKFLKKINKKVFGICAGAQIIALINEIKLIKLKKKLIGQHYIKNKKRFFLTSYLFLINNKKAYSFKIKNFKAVSYHPEVYKELLEEIKF
jgi:anthranilate/para-aminobenzoate synthase component II